MSLAIFCACAAWFVSDLVGVFGNTEDRFSHDEANYKDEEDGSYCGSDIKSSSVTL